MSPCLSVSPSVCHCLAPLARFIYPWLAVSHCLTPVTNFLLPSPFLSVIVLHQSQPSYYRLLVCHCLAPVATFLLSSPCLSLSCTSCKLPTTVSLSGIVLHQSQPSCYRLLVCHCLAPVATFLLSSPCLSLSCTSHNFSTAVSMSVCHCLTQGAHLLKSPHLPARAASIAYTQRWSSITKLSKVPAPSSTPFTATHFSKPPAIIRSRPAHHKLLYCWYHCQKQDEQGFFFFTA